MIETPNLKLKKWQSSDLVTDMLTWLNSNADAIDGDTRVLRERPWSSNTDANTLGTGFYGVAQPADWAQYNYPDTYGLLVSFNSSYFAFQIFARSNGLVYYMRSRTDPTTWTAWKTLTVT